MLQGRRCDASTGPIRSLTEYSENPASCSTPVGTTREKIVTTNSKFGRQESWGLGLWGSHSPAQLEMLVTGLIAAGKVQYQYLVGLSLAGRRRRRQERLPGWPSWLSANERAGENYLLAAYNANSKVCRQWQTSGSYGPDRNPVSG
ncbi:unnamed protein product [Calypogeia fissa]